MNDFIDFGELKSVPLCEIWSNETPDFVQWIALNLYVLGKTLGLELELIKKEATFGDFSLLLAKDLCSSKIVIIENQITQTDHDHFGNLLTHAAGFDASIVIWVAEKILDEHRQTLEWLNQKTDTETDFWGIAVEILKIDKSKPAFNFKPVVFPNKWYQSKKQNNSPN